MCQSCKYRNKYVGEHPCDKCTFNTVSMYEPMTNFDKIISMDITQLAEFICGIYNEPYGEKFINGVIIPDYDEDAIKEWLTRKAD